MVLILIPIILLLLALTYYIIKSKRSSSSKSSNKATTDSLLTDHELSKNNDNPNQSAEKDVQYLLSNLNSSSTHLEILLILATTPQNLSITNDGLQKEDEIKQQRLNFLNPNQTSTSANSVASSVNDKDDKTSSNDNMDFDLDGDWGDDDDDDDDAKKMNEQRLKEKEMLAKEVKAASGKNDDMIKQIKIEGIDDGVLGQKWVEKTLTDIGQWPPKTNANIDALKELDTNPAIRRNVCMLMGRLNSTKLNSSPELMEAGQNQLIDFLYFQSTQEYRKRTIVFLETALKIIGTTRSYTLYKKLVECYTMFKIGITSPTSNECITNFQQTMIKTFDGEKGIPKLDIPKIDIVTDDYEDVVNGEVTSLQLELHRLHGENFMKQKIAMAQKQGIPPQIALHSFREGWQILLRWEKIGDCDDISNNVGNDDFVKNHPFLNRMTKDIQNKFQLQKGNVLINAWPFEVTNMTQGVGKVKVRFMSPKESGKYKFYVDVKSTDYLGCDQSLTVEKEILDKEKIERVEKKKVKDKDGKESADGEEEPKKTK